MKILRSFWKALGVLKIFKFSLHYNVHFEESSLQYILVDRARAATFKIF